MSALSGILCYAEHEAEAIGVWEPPSSTGENVLALVCEAHVAQALERRYGRVRLFGEKVWRSGSSPS